MQNIQESAASTCIQKIDTSKVALSRKAPLTMEQLNLELEPVFTKPDFEKELKK